MIARKLRDWVWRGIFVGCVLFWIVLAYTVSKAVGLTW